MKSLQRPRPRPLPSSSSGRYEVMQRIGAGGMAEVYLARCQGLYGFEKLMVLKRLLPQFAEQEDFVTMLLDEARLLAQLAHPNIAAVYDLVVDEAGNHFIAMEHVDGADLSAIIHACRRQRARMPMAQVLAVGIGVAAGLHAAHEQRGVDGRLLGIVHRDVSPSNVLVSRTGCVKLIDFGIAKAACSVSVTQAGQIKGKCDYMSPEQVCSRPIDRRSDVFSLGVLLYELTVGRRPFVGAGEYAVLSAVVGSTPPRPSRLRPGYPRELERIILRALSKEPEKRHPTAEALGLELKRFARAADYDLSAVALARFMRAILPDVRRPSTRVAPAPASRSSAEPTRCLPAPVEGQRRASDQTATFELPIEIELPAGLPQPGGVAAPQHRATRWPRARAATLLLSLALAGVLAFHFASTGSASPLGDRALGHAASLVVTRSPPGTSTPAPLRSQHGSADVARKRRPSLGRDASAATPRHVPAARPSTVH